MLVGNAKNDFSRAANEFIAGQLFQADRPENRVALGIFFAQLGRLDEAAREYRASLRLDARHTPAYVNLADVLRAQGREADAEGVLRSGLAASPQDATLHHALGLSLVRSGKLADALPELERAASLAPDQPHFAYVYAVALHSARRDREALEVLRLHPEDNESRTLLESLKR
jgi:Flp pilus assembly protein TadD